VEWFNLCAKYEILEVNVFNIRCIPIVWLLFPQIIMELIWSSTKCVMEVYEIGYSCNLVNCSSLPTVHRLRRSAAVNLHIWHSVVLQSIDWLMVLTEIKTNSHFLPSREAVQILLKSPEECNNDATWFSWPHRPAVLHDFRWWLLFFGLH